VQVLLRHPLRNAFLLALVSVGVPFWQIPYRAVNVPDALYGPGLGVVFLLALLLSASGRVGFGRTLNVMAAAVPAAVLVRVVVEGVLDPTRHNLWPLVMIIAAVVGYVAATPGALLGYLIGRLRGGDA